MMQLYMGMNRDPGALRDVQIQLESSTSKIQQLQRQIDQINASDAKTPRSSIKQSPGDEEVQLRKSTSVSAMPNSWRYRLSHFRADTLAGTQKQKRPSLNVMKGVLQNVSDIILRLQSKDDTFQGRLDTINTFCKLVRTAGRIEHKEYVDELLKCLFKMLLVPVPEIRAGSLRALRYLCQDKSTIDWLFDKGLEVVFLKSLSREQKQTNSQSNTSLDTERESCVKLIRHIIDTTNQIPRSIVGILGALCEQPEDKLRFLAAETLCELVIKNPEWSSETGVLRYLVQMLQEGPKLLIDMIVPSLCFLLDHPDTRQFLLKEGDLDTALCMFTDVHQRTQEDKLKLCNRSIQQLVRSFQGITFLCQGNLKYIRDLIQALRLPYDELKRAIVECLFEVFNVQEKPVGPKPLVTSMVNEIEDFDNYQYLPYSLADHHISLLLCVFIECGLVDVLCEVIETENKQLIQRCNLLVAELIKLGMRVLPCKYRLELLALKRYFRYCCEFQDEHLRHLASLSLTQIDKLTRVKSDLVRNNLDIKLRMNYNMDSDTFKQLLNDSQVLLFKEYQKWNFDAVDELLITLRNPKRLDEVLKSTKFVKRVLAFFKPRKHRFSDMKHNKTTARYLFTADLLFKCLLESSEGFKYLQENTFLSQLKECLAELDPINLQQQLEDPVFSKERIEGTMTQEFFRFFRVFQEYPEGVELLEKFKFFDLFYHLVELKSRDDIVKQIIVNLDYFKPNVQHPRVILTKVLTSGSKNLRIFATNYARLLARNNPEKDNEWMIRLLVYQLYDPLVEVGERAVMALDEACSIDKRNLEHLIRIAPHLDHLTEIASPLLLKFLTCESGFALLQRAYPSYIEKELEYWFKEGNSKYKDQAELSLNGYLNNQLSSIAKSVETKLSQVTPSTEVIQKKEMNGILLPHFYGELVKTQFGRAFLQEKQHFEKFHHVIVSQNGDIDHLKSCLWAVGNIGSVKAGFEAFLFKHGTLDEIVKLAYTTPVISIKGTCLYVLGLLSRNVEVAQWLEEEFGWVSLSEGGLAIPPFQKFFAIEPWNQHPITKNIPVFSQESDTQELKDLFKNIGNLSNHVLANAASKALNKLKQEQLYMFVDAGVYKRVLEMISHYHFRLTARKFINDLFDNADLTEVGRIS